MTLRIYYSQFILKVRKVASNLLERFVQVDDGAGATKRKEIILLRELKTGRCGEQGFLMF